MHVTRMVIHADDVGFCHGANEAYVELSRLGTITAGSAMVPCPWFHDLAGRADDGLDLGVHVTLTSEHDGYRWGPLTKPSSAAGLTDEHGFFWPRVAQVREHAHPDAVEAEMHAQLERALAAGIDVTHLDAHMGAALAPEWCDRYVALGIEFDVPVLITEEIGNYGPNNHLTGVAEERFADFVAQARTAGMPIFDVVLETDFRRRRGTTADYPALMNSVDDDLVYCAFHPCQPGPGEVERIDHEWWHVRTDEYELFRTSVWSEWLAEQGFEPIGMRELRDEWRQS